MLACSTTPCRYAGRLNSGVRSLRALFFAAALHSALARSPIIRSHARDSSAAPRTAGGSSAHRRSSRHLRCARAVTGFSLGARGLSRLQCGVVSWLARRFPQHARIAPALPCCPCFEQLRVASRRALRARASSLRQAWRPNNSFKPTPLRGAA